MSTDVSRRGILIGGATVSAATVGASACATTGSGGGGAGDMETPAVDEEIKLLDQAAARAELTAAYAKLGFLVAAYAMDQVALKRLDKDYDKLKTLPISLSLDLDLVVLDDCCQQTKVISSLLSAELLELHALQPWKSQNDIDFQCIKCPG